MVHTFAYYSSFCQLISYNIGNIIIPTTDASPVIVFYAFSRGLFVHLPPALDLRLACAQPLATGLHCTLRLY